MANKLKRPFTFDGERHDYDNQCAPNQPSQIPIVNAWAIGILYTKKSK